MSVPTKRWSIGAVVVAAVLALAGAGQAQDPQRGGVLRVGLQGDFTTMDPHLSTSAEDRDLYYQLYSPLVGLDANLKIVPELAESWEQPDPLTYLFRLRRGVKFHDGTDLTAEVVKWNFERMLNPATGSIRRSELGERQGGRRGRPAHGAGLTLKEPDAALLATLSDRAGMIVSRGGRGEAAAGLRASPGRHWPLPVRGVGKGRSPHRPPVPRVLEGRSSASRRDRLQADPGPHGQARPPSGPAPWI